MRIKYVRQWLLLLWYQLVDHGVAPSIIFNACERPCVNVVIGHYLPRIIYRANIHLSHTY